MKNVTLASAHVMTHPTRILFTSANFRNKDPPPQSICANEQTRLSAEKSHQWGRAQHGQWFAISWCHKAQGGGDRQPCITREAPAEQSPQRLKSSRVGWLARSCPPTSPWHLGHCWPQREAPPLQELPRQRGGVSGLGGGGLGCTRSSP